MNTETKSIMEEMKETLAQMDEVITVSMTVRDYHNIMIALARAATQSQAPESFHFSASLTSLAKGKVV